MPIPVPVELELPTSVGGFLTSVGTLPTGWERGISFTDTSCLLPVVVGECPATSEVVTPGADAVHSFTITPTETPATGGSFTLTFAEGTTAPIAFDADAATIDAAIEAVLGTGTVMVAGTLPGPITITYGGSLGDQPRALPTGDGSGLTGTPPYTVEVTETTPGALPEVGPTNLKPTQRPDGFETFRPVSVITAVTCSTMGGFDVSGAASDVLDRTRDYALASELLTGAASARDAGPASVPNPSLVSAATDLGADFASLAAALACVEQTIGQANGGRGAVILVGNDLMTRLKESDLLWRDGARWRTAAGSLVLASPAFDGRAPDSTAPPAADSPLYMYAVTWLWAGAGSRFELADVNRLNNDVNSRAEDIALVAFPTCAVYAAASTTATAC